MAEMLGGTRFGRGKDKKAPVTKADLPYIRCGVCESVAKHAVIVVENMRSMATQANKVRPGIDLDFLGTRHPVAWHLPCCRVLTCWTDMPFEMLFHSSKRQILSNTWKICAILTPSGGMLENGSRPSICRKRVMSCSSSRWETYVMPERCLFSWMDFEVHMAMNFSFIVMFTTAWGVRVRMLDCSPLMRRPHGPGRPYGDQRGSVGGSEASRD